MLVEEDLLGETTDKITYAIKGTKYMKLSDIEKMYNGFWGKYKFLKMLKKEKVNEDRYRLTESDKKIKGKKLAK